MKSQDADLCSVVRIIRYTGTREALQKQMAKSMALGIHEKGHITITVSEHSSDLPQVDYLCPSAVEDTLSKAKPVVEPSGEVGTSEPGPFMDTMIEDKAVNIYNSWQGQEGWTPWVHNGNSLKQQAARKLAREFYEKAE